MDYNPILRDHLKLKVKEYSSIKLNKEYTEYYINILEEVGYFISLRNSDQTF